MFRFVFAFLIASAVLFSAESAGATTIDFFNLTGNGANVASQLKAELTDAGNGQILFQFLNIGSTSSIITDIYFDDGTLLGIASIQNSAGVSFSQGASPGDLPGGQNASPPFQTTAGFSADSNPPVSHNGVRNTTTGTEWVKITFNLINGKTFADTVAALQLGGQEGGLRIGLHVRGLPGGKSDSYINTTPPSVPSVPDGGATLALLGLALAGLGIAARTKTK